MRNFMYLLAVTVLVSGIAQAENLAVWEFDDRAPSGPKTATNAQVMAANIDTAVLSHTTLDNLRSSAYHDDWYNSAAWGGPSTLAAALSSGDYYIITVTPQDGLIMNLTNLFINICVEGLATGESCEVAIFSSAEGFTEGDEIATTTPANGDRYKALSIDLSPATHSGLTSVVFRAYCYGIPSDYDRFGIGFVALVDGANDLVVSGTTDSAAQRGTLFLVK